MQHNPNIPNPPTSCTLLTDDITEDAQEEQEDDISNPKTGTSEMWPDGTQQERSYEPTLLEIAKGNELIEYIRVMNAHVA